MRRADSNAEAGDGLPGEDSFLDIVANIVGILIILVMVVGVRASQGAFAEKKVADAGPLDAAKNTADVEPADSGAAAVDREMRAIYDAQRKLHERLNKVADLNAERRIAEAQRERLLMIQSLQQQDLDERRQRLSESQRRQFDVQQQLVDAKLKHQSLTTEHISLVSQEADVEEIECLPTPMASTVDGPAVHVRLRNGLLAVVPFDALKDEFLNGRLGYLRNGVRSRDEVADVVGPIDGFRMRLLIERYRESPVGASPLVAAHSTRVQEVQTWTILPTSQRLGLAPQRALLPEAPLMQRIRTLRSTDVAVVAWVYPDSFDQLRELKRALWELRVPLAVWPLGENDEIVFSSRGSKAAAQ